MRKLKNKEMKMNIQVTTKKGAKYNFTWKKAGAPEFYKKSGKVVLASEKFDPANVPQKAALVQIDYWLKTAKNDVRVTPE